MRTPRRARLLTATALAAAAVPLAAMAGPASAATSAASAASTASAASAPTAYVDVSVATVWTGPDSPRPIDAPALGNPVHPEQWLAGMTLADKQAMSADNLTQTQALFGGPVRIIGSQGDWDEVAVPGQATPKNPLGYPGWIPKDQLTTNDDFGRQLADRPFAQVDHATTAWLYKDPGLHSKALRVSADTRLPELARTADAVLVATPDRGPEWLGAQDVHVYRTATDIPAPTGADLVRYAEQYLGTPYLWGGRSGFGVDCSGFTSMVYEANGIAIPRDADAQALYGGGRRVDQADLQPGDLMYYADDGGKGSIYHVAMYIGGGRMIEAYDSATPVRITAARFGGDYWGATRFLPDAAASAG
jgi:cell wall-associated NlpC family hydrolase